MSEAVLAPKLNTCPKCDGFIHDHDHYDQGEEIWIRYSRCLNCGLHHEQFLMKGYIREMDERAGKVYHVIGG